MDDQQQPQTTDQPGEKGIDLSARETKEQIDESGVEELTDGTVPQGASDEGTHAGTRDAGCVMRNA